jgi:hypothetical protein
MFISSSWFRPATGRQEVSIGVTWTTQFVLLAKIRCDKPGIRWGYLGRTRARGSEFVAPHICGPARRDQVSLTSILPRFSPLKSLKKAEGALSMPYSTVSRHLILPSPTQSDSSLIKTGCKSA